MANSIVTLKLKPYPIFFEVLNLIKQELPEAILAGGAVSDNIMHRHFRDLDIFVRQVNKKAADNLKKSFGYFKKVYAREEDYGTLVRGLYEFTYKGFKCHLVVVTDTIKKVDMFDLTFRQAIFDGNKIYVYRQALEDIQNKILRVNSLASPIVTLSRIVKFQKRYGYRPDSQSIKLLLEAIKNNPSSLQVLQTRRFPAKVKAGIMSYISQINSLTFTSNCMTK